MSQRQSFWERTGGALSEDSNPEPQENKETKLVISSRGKNQAEPSSVLDESEVDKENIKDSSDFGENKIEEEAWMVKIKS